MSAMPPPPTSAGTSAPGSILMAKYMMWAGAVLQLVTILTFVIGLDDARSQIEQTLTQQGSAVTESAIDTAVMLAVGATVATGVVGAIVWVLMARFTSRGKGWARIASTVLCALLALSVLGSVLAPTTTLTLAVKVLMLLEGVFAVFFLWQKDSTAWFRAHKAAQA